MKGRLKIFLGYAAGVGKTWKMLDEAQRLKARGVDVVIGYFEPHKRKDTIEKTGGMEIVPRRKVFYRDTVFEEMDTDAIIRRHPAVCLVDELAHTNAPGSERAKRWQDVQIILENGIDVLSTMNVQHLESLNDQVREITGIAVRETVPDWVADTAEEVVMVDLTPGALRHRLERGVIYSAEKARQAMEHFFTESNLSALREMALRHTAHEVEGRLDDLRPAPGRTASTAPGRQDCILVCLTARPSAAMLIRRGKRVADYLQARCLAIHVTGSGRGVENPETEAVARHLSFARNLRIDARIVEGDDVARTIADFARQNGVTQIFVGRPASTGWRAVLKGNTIRDLVRLAKNAEITIVAERRR